MDKKLARSALVKNAVSDPGWISTTSTRSRMQKQRAKEAKDRLFVANDELRAVVAASATGGPPPDAAGPPVVAQTPANTPADYPPRVYGAYYGWLVGVATLWVIFVFGTSVYKFGIMWRCLLSGLAYKVFPWMKPGVAMPSSVYPAELMLHLATALLSEVLSLLTLVVPFLAPYVGLKKSAWRGARYLTAVFHLPLSYIIATNITHLGTSPREVALAFNGIPLAGMTVGWLGVLFAPEEHWLARYGDLLYFGALNLAPLFETLYRLALSVGA